MMLTGKIIVLGVGASISAYKAADLCSKLVQEGATVYPIVTEAALRFVGAATFWGLSGQPVSTGVFEEPFGASEIAHLRYGELADLIVIAPASADLLARLAGGFCDDMLTAVVVANPGKPILIAPAMNTNMWQNAATQTNRRTLEARGYIFIEPGIGRLAEGIIGAGRLAEPPEIVEIICETLFPKRNLEGKRVLVTAGPTREAIDPVRYLSNRSSGKMGYAVAEAAAARGAIVTLISGPTNLPNPSGVAEIVRVTSAAEMAAATFARSDSHDIIVACAAVADYAPVEIAPQKIKKSGDAAILTLTLTPTTDILRELGNRKRPNQLLIGFAAETENLAANAQKKLTEKNLDLIIANDVTQEGAGFDADTNIVTFHHREGDPMTLPQMSKRAVADAIWDRIRHDVG